MATNPTETGRTNGASDANPAEAKAATTQDAMLASLGRLLANGGKGLSMAGAAMVKAMLPLLAIYATGAVDDGQEGTEGEGKDDAAALKARQARIVSAAGTKALLELIEVASRVRPLTPDSQPFLAYRDGRAQAPNIEQILSLGLVAMALFARSGDADEPEKGDEEPAPAPETFDRVTYVAVAPGEYQAMSGPMTPAEIRRYAMRERSYSQPQLAMLARRDNSFSVLPASAGSGSAMMMAANQRPTAEQYGRLMLAARSSGQCGCGCGGACGCGSGSGGPTGSCPTCGTGGAFIFPPARLDADGNCRKFTSVSCDTQTRIRECFKIALCDLMRCVGDQVCEDGMFSGQKPDLVKCLEGFVCSLLTCLPEAICPPPPASDICITVPVSDCDCNYAVGS